MLQARRASQLQAQEAVTRRATPRQREIAEWAFSNPTHGLRADTSAAVKRRDAFDFDQHRGIRKRLDDAGRAGGVRRRPEGPGVQSVHWADLGRMRQQHVALDQIPERCARLVENALDVANDKTELRLKTVRNRAVFVKTGDA